MKLSKKGQIAIFLIIGVIIISLLVFLFSFDANEKKDEVHSEKKQSTAASGGNDNKLSFLKDNIDFCLKKQLIRATIISGARGGFIYDKGEDYIGNVWNLYDNRFLTNVDISVNELKEAMVFSNTDLNYTGIESNGPHSHSIKEDFEKYILVNFLDCIDFDGLKEKGYTLYYDEYSIKSNGNRDGNKFFFDGIFGNEGDDVETYVGGKRFIGEIDKTDAQTNKTVVIFNSQTQINSNMISITGVKSEIDVNVVFNDESIIAKLDFPITIEFGGYKSSYKDSSATLNVRFKNLHKLATLLIKEKYFDNRSMDITDPIVITKLINGSIGPGLSYFSNMDKSNISIEKFDVITQGDHIGRIYSIVDYDFKILGDPYKFNFGYVNHAPMIIENDISSTGGIYENGAVIYYMSPNGIPVNFDLRKFTVDPQNSDNLAYIGANQFYFIPQQTHLKYADFILEESGLVTYSANSAEIFSTDVTATDGEMEKKFNIKFVAGLSDNTGNQLASRCFEFEPVEVPSIFPIDGNSFGYQSVFDQVGSNSHHVFAFNQYIPNSVSPEYNNLNGTLKFFPSCAGPEGTYDDIVVTQGNQVLSYNSDTGEIVIPQSQQPTNIVVSVKKDGNSITEPYEITIYPVRCLGPAPIGNQDMINNLGGDLSCCDMSVLEKMVSGEESPSALIGSNSNLQNDIALNSEVLIGMDIEESLDYLKNNNIWSNNQNKIYSSRIKAQCGNGYPTVLMTADFNSSGSETFSDVDVYYNGETVRTYSTLNLDMKSVIDKCEFKILNKSSGIYLDIEGLKHIVSFNYDGDAIFHNGPLPSEFSNTYVLCDDGWYNSSDSNTWEVLSDHFGLGGEKDTSYSYVDKYYCDSGSNSCNIRSGSPTYNRFNDDTCTDYFFNINTEQVSSQGNSDWICGVYISGYEEPEDCPCGTSVEGEPVYSEVTCSNGVCPNSNSAPIEYFDCPACPSSN